MLFYLNLGFSSSKFIICICMSVFCVITVNCERTCKFLYRLEPSKENRKCIWPSFLHARRKRGVKSIQGKGARVKVSHKGGRVLGKH